MANEPYGQTLLLKFGVLQLKVNLSILWDNIHTRRIIANAEGIYAVITQ